MSEKSTILVVDDNENNRDLIARRLQRKGYAVLTAENGMEALDLLDSAAVDLVVLDIMMPVLTGIDVLKKVRQTRSPAELPIIMATAKDQSEDVVEALENGANDYVTKPLDFPVILARVEAQLRMKAAAAPKPATPERDANDGDFVSLIGAVRPGMVLGKKYKLESEIGTGNFGVVFRASHLGFQQSVAVKILQTPVEDSPEALARFQQEGRSAFRLHHPNAVSVLDFSVTPAGLAYLVMEELVGRTLEAEIKQHGGKLWPERAVEITLPICEVLHEAHEIGIIHRDIKPANVFLHQTRREEVVKVLDFGIAKLVGDAAMGQSMTMDEGILGTPAYMAPERLQGHPYDGRADAYGVGILLYQMLAGRTPFLAAHNEAMAIAMMHVSNEPDPLDQLQPDLPPQLVEAVMAMLIKDPARRPTVAELGRRLAEVAGREVPLALREEDPDATHVLDDSDAFDFADLLAPPPSPPDKSEVAKTGNLVFSDDVFGLGKASWEED